MASVFAMKTASFLRHAEKRARTISSGLAAGAPRRILGKSGHGAQEQQTHGETKQVCDFGCNFVEHNPQQSWRLFC